MTAASQWLACSLVLWLPGTVSANAPQTRLVHRGRPLAVRAIGKPWTQRDGHIELGGRPHTITAGVRILPGDFHVKARLRILDQKNSAASFFSAPSTVPPAATLTSDTCRWRRWTPISQL